MSSRRTTDLERLTQPGGKVLPDDASIPVLTERLTLPSLDLDISLPQPPPPMVAPPAPKQSPPPPVAAPSPPPAAPSPAPAEVLTPRSEPLTEPMTAPATVPGDIPTTIVEPPRTTTVTAAPPTTVTRTTVTRTTAAGFAAPAAPAPEPTSAPPIEINWAHAEARVREALLRELQPRLAADIDRQLRERLQPTLVRMMLATLTELRPAVDAAVREVIERAVAAEIARQRSGK